jgi:hypothetical protein
MVSFCLSSSPSSLLAFFIRVWDDLRLLTRVFVVFRNPSKETLLSYSCDKNSPRLRPFIGFSIHNHPVIRHCITSLNKQVITVSGISGYSNSAHAPLTETTLTVSHSVRISKVAIEWSKDLLNNVIAGSKTARDMGINPQLSVVFICK